MNAKNTNNQVISTGSYKPKKTSMKTLALMQTIAKDANMPLADMAKLLGHDCIYSWQKAITTTSYERSFRNAETD